MPKIISPTVGRVVHFRPSHMDTDLSYVGNRPLAAIVAYVHSDTCVNLTVFDVNGVPHSRTSVTLRQPEDEAPKYGYCEWMPFQVGQSVKTEAAEAELAEVRRMASAGEPLIDVEKNRQKLFPTD